jgi:hypothetical protein
LTRVLNLAQLDTAGKSKDRITRIHDFILKNLSEPPTTLLLPDSSTNSSPIKQPSASARPVTPVSKPIRSSAQPKFNSGTGTPVSTLKSTLSVQNSSRQPFTDLTNQTSNEAVDKAFPELKQGKVPAPPITHNDGTGDSLIALAATFLSNLSVFTKDELRSECMNCGLARGGSKADLAQRLANYLAQQELQLQTSRKSATTTAESRNHVDRSTRDSQILETT